eukprot:436959_1
MSSVQTDIAVNIYNHNQNTYSTILPPTQTTLQKEISQITSNIKKQEEEFVIYLDKKNDFWHKCFQHDTADKIANFIMSSRWMYVIVMPILITSLLCRYIDMLFDYQYIPATFASLWILCHLFCFNCSMLKRMTKSFVFWYKMYNWCVAIVCYLILSGASHHYTGEGGNVLFGTILIIATASHDGSRMNRILKIMFAFCLLGITILFGGYVYFNGNSQIFGDHSPFIDISFNIFNESLSVRAVCIGSVMNLLIFFTKQCGLLIMYKGKATTLSTRANITWIDNLDQNQTNVYDVEMP